MHFSPGIDCSRSEQHTASVFDVRDILPSLTYIKCRSFYMNDLPLLCNAAACAPGPAPFPMIIFHNFQFLKTFSILLSFEILSKYGICLRIFDAFQNASFKIRKKDFVFGKTSDFLLFRGLGTIKLHACVKADEIDIIYEKQEEPQSFVLFCFDVDCTTFPHLSYQRYILWSSHFVQKF